MKQQKRHNKPAEKSAKDKSKYLSWLFIVPACAYILWFWHIDNKTLFEPEWWWLIVFAIIGFAVGIIRLIKDKEIVWNWKEYLGGNLLFFNIFSRWSHSLFAIKVNNRTCKLLYTLKPSLL